MLSRFDTEGAMGMGTIGIPWVPWDSHGMGVTVTIPWKWEWEWE